jgi:serine/threonine-protein kinase PknG
MSACVRPGCDGTYGAHGYCGRCGRKAPKAERPAEKSEPVSGRARSRRSGRGTAPTVSDRFIGSTRPKTGIVVDLPEVAPRDPATLSWVDWEVSESKRFCHNATCGEPVGRGRDGKPGLTSGFCRKCGWKFVAGPTLSKGELVDKRYEIFHCIARGGQGWIYLARDRNLGDEVAEHWVVLKGLIDTDDPDAAEQAVLERRYLTEVSHPNIVKINDFVRHPDPLTGRESGYIVMEYVAGRSLLELYREHRDEYGLRAPLPLTHVLAYGIDVLTAMDYLHRRGLLYSDFKPENTLISGTELKLIDLGAVLRAGEPVRALYRTPGYAPPELEPSVAADIYTVGRTLAVLSLEFVGFSKDFQHRLPDPADAPLLAEQESFHRLLRRATHPDAAHRFGSAQEMRGQLEGVLLEVQSDADGQPRPAISTRFGVERRTFGTDAGFVSIEDTAAASVDWTAVVAALPAPLVDPADPSAGYLAAIAATDPDDVIDALRAIPSRTQEVVLQLVGAQIAAGHLADAEADLNGYAGTAPNDWRVSWHRGMIALAGGRPREARVAFDAVYDALPGELAPKLALAAASEWDGDDGRAEELYDRVWRTNDSYVSAAFGLARVLGRQGDPDSAVDALDGVPESSSQHQLAQVAAIRTRLTSAPAKPNLLEASARLQRLKLGIERRALLSIELLTAALDWVRGDKTGDRSGAVLGQPLEERRLRLGVEQAYRDLAKVSTETDRRIALVKQANRIRPRTWF